MRRIFAHNQGAGPRWTLSLSNTHSRIVRFFGAAHRRVNSVQDRVERHTTGGDDAAGGANSHGVLLRRAGGGQQKHSVPGVFFDTVPQHIMRKTTTAVPVS